MEASRRFALALAAIVGIALLASFGASAQAPYTPGQAATDFLFTIVLGFALAIGVLVMALIALVVIKFRKRRGHTEPPKNPKTEDRKLETAWTVVPAIILIIVGALTFQTLRATDTIPQADVTVTVVGHQWFWEFFTDNGTGNPTRSIGEFTVKEGQNVKLLIESRDVAHALYIIDFGLKVDAIPGQTNVYWFQALQAGDYQIRCAEYCGENHWAMVATLHVQPA